MSEPMKRPGVGTGVYVRKDGKILLGKRKGSAGSGTWSAPGGKLDMYEDWFDCAKRETLEEAGIEIDNVRLITVTNDMAPEAGSHYVTFQFVADYKSGEVRNMEPDKCDGWEWFDWDNLPEPLFWSTRNFVKSGYNPFNI